MAKVLIKVTYKVAIMKNFIQKIEYIANWECKFICRYVDTVSEPEFVPKANEWNVSNFEIK